MREILFRMYDGVKMVYDGLVIYNGELYEDWRAFEDGIKSDNPLMQYTGLDDKNGVKIFEGDVVLVRGEEDQCTIVWDLEELEYGIDMEDVQVKLGCFYGRDLKVIGNIHDNQEVTE